MVFSFISDDDIEDYDGKAKDCKAVRLLKGDEEMIRNYIAILEANPMHPDHNLLSMLRKKLKYYILLKVEMQHFEEFVKGLNHLLVCECITNQLDHDSSFLFSEQCFLEAMYIRLYVFLYNRFPEYIWGC